MSQRGVGEVRRREKGVCRERTAREFAKSLRKLSNMPFSFRSKATAQHADWELRTNLLSDSCPSKCSLDNISLCFMRSCHLGAYGNMRGSCCTLFLTSSAPLQDSDEKLGDATLWSQRKRMLQLHRCWTCAGLRAYASNRRCVPCLVACVCAIGLRFGFDLSAFFQYDVSQRVCWAGGVSSFPFFVSTSRLRLAK